MFDAVTARLVLALARDGSIGRTAERENIAPSAVSRRLSELERRLGLALFDRTPQGVKLTRAGDVYARECSRIMRDLADLDIRMGAMARGHVGFLRLAATTSALSGRLPEALAAFSKAFPDVAVELNEMNASTALAALDDARVDAAIVADNYDLTAFETEAFDDDRVFVIGPPDHAFAGTLDIRRSVPFEQASRYEVVAVHETGALDRLLDEAAAKLSRRLGKRIKAETFSSLVRLVEAGFGLGFLRATSLYLLAGTDLKAAPLADDWANRKLMLAWRRTTQSNAALENFRELANRLYHPRKSAGTAAERPQAAAASVSAGT